MPPRGRYVGSLRCKNSSAWGEASEVFAAAPARPDVRLSPAPFTGPQSTFNVLDLFSTLSPDQFPISEDRTCGNRTISVQGAAMVDTAVVDSLKVLDPDGRLEKRTSMMAQNDIAKLYREFEEAYVDFLTAEGEGVLVARRKQLYRVRTRLLAHKDFTEQEYEAAVLRADARARALAGQAPL
jgi:hypothetical protein